MLHEFYCVNQQQRIVDKGRVKQIKSLQTSYKYAPLGDIIRILKHARNYVSQLTPDSQVGSVHAISQAKESNQPVQDILLHTLNYRDHEHESCETQNDNAIVTSESDQSEVISKEIKIKTLFLNQGLIFFRNHLRKWVGFRHSLCLRQEFA